MTVPGAPARIEIMLAGDPATKARPRFTGSGHAYTPKRTSDAEEAIGWAVREVAVGITPDASGQYGIWARFYQQSFQRRDLDNMLKLVSDACNGLIWADDAQVVQIDARLVRGSDEPRSHIVFTRLVDSDEHVPTRSCAHCGAVFRLYPSTSAKKTACSATCAARLRSGVDLSEPIACEQCQVRFRRRTSAQRFCSEACRREAMRGRNRVTAVPNVCADCGSATPNHRARRCRSCWRRSLVKP